MCHDSSTVQAGAPERSAKEKVAPLRLDLQIWAAQTDC